MMKTYFPWDKQNFVQLKLKQKQQKKKFKENMNS